MNWQKIIDQSAPSVILIEAGSSLEQAEYGLGFIVKVIKPLVFVLTGAHVIPDTKYFRATFTNLEKEHYPSEEVYVVGKLNPNNEDLALLAIDISEIGNNLGEIKELPLGLSVDVQIPQDVCAIVYLQSLEIHSQSGQINGRIGDWFQLSHDIWVEPGYSGGPLFNTAGEVIAILRALSKKTNLAVATPIQYAQSLVAPLIDPEELKILNQLVRFYPKVKKMPFPIAYTYQLFMLSEPSERVDRFCFFLETVLEFFAAIMIKDCLIRKSTNRWDGKKIKQILNSPTLNGWKEIIEMICSDVPGQGDSLVPELYNFCSQKDKTIQNLTAYQNQQLPTDFDRCLEEFLGEIDFLKGYLLFVNDSITMRKEKCHNSISVWMEDSPRGHVAVTYRRRWETGIPLLKPLGKYEDPSHPLIYDSPSKAEVLELYPLVYFDADAKQILLYQAQQDGRLEFRSCQEKGKSKIIDNEELIEDFKRLLENLYSKFHTAEEATSQSEQGSSFYQPATDAVKEDTEVLFQKLNQRVSKAVKEDEGRSQSLIEILKTLGITDEELDIIDKTGKPCVDLPDGIDARRAKFVIQQHMQAGYPLLGVLSWEEERVVQVLKDIAQEIEYSIYVWSFSQGLIDSESIKDSLRDPVEILDCILTEEGNAIFVLKDFHNFVDDPLIQRKLRDAIAYFRKGKTKKAMVLLSPFLSLPEELQKDFTVFSYPLPEEEELSALLFEVIERNKVKVNFTTLEGIEQLAFAALGLTLSEAEGVFNQAIIAGNSKLDTTSIHYVIREKEQMVRKTGLLEFFQSADTIQDVGGFQNVKRWLRSHKDDLTSSTAILFGLQPAKGILLVGVPGCGKSLCARAIAAEWQRPLLRMDIGRLFSGLVGASEENMRRAIAIAEASAPAILWIDEVDRGFSGATSREGSGVTARIFGTFLTWMQEKRSPVFVVATANDVTTLPGEFLRGGRFDAVFFVDLPSSREREEIFRIHLRKHQSRENGIQLNKFDLERLAKMTDGFNGAEIEQVIISALYDAFEAGPRPLMQEDIEKSIKEIIPLSQTMREKVSELRKWGELYALPASKRR